jgi:hypothetical protein
MPVFSRKIRAFAGVSAAILALAIIAAPEPASAQAGLNVLVVGVDDDLDTIPRSNRIFNRVLAELQNQLRQSGYAVWDEVAVTRGNFVQDRVRRSDSEILDVANLVQKPPIDVVAAFSIYADARQTQTTTIISARITGKLLLVPEGRNLGNFEVDSPDNWTAPFICNHECLLEAVGDKARILGQSLGDVLGALLDAEMSQRAGAVSAGSTQPAAATVRTYTLTFDNFTDDEWRLMEEYLVAFMGYVSHRPIYMGPRHVEISYSSSIDEAGLMRRMSTARDRMGINWRVFNKGRAEYQLVKLPTVANTEGL